jgi:hypothetical protein
MPLRVTRSWWWLQNLRRIVVLLRQFVEGEVCAQALESKVGMPISVAADRDFCKLFFRVKARDQQQVKHARS